MQNVFILVVYIVTYHTFIYFQFLTITVFSFVIPTVIIALGNTKEEYTSMLQTAINQVSSWTKVKLNKTKSIHLILTNRKTACILVYINQQSILHVDTVKYLDITFDTKLRLNVHVKGKRKSLELKYRKLYWLLGKESILIIYNKFLLYKLVLNPPWTFRAHAPLYIRRT